MKKRAQSLLAAIMIAVVGISYAQSSPVGMLQGIANRMISQLEANKSNLKRGATVHSIVRGTLLPYVDLDRMSALVVGPRYWRAASSAQKSQFKREFTRMVISTYAAALSSYNGDRVLFYPLRGGAGSGNVSVRSVIVRSTGQRIPVSYNLARSGGGWRIYDFSVENVSIVRSYNAQFAGVLANSGMSGLIQRLAKHNQRTR